jgi:hypothetical protein
MEPKGDEMSDIVRELIEIVSTARPIALKRMRLAISPKEYEEIKEYFFKQTDVFYVRIMNVPLIVESDPENPPLVIEEKR